MHTAMLVFACIYICMEGSDRSNNNINFRGKKSMDTVVWLFAFIVFVFCLRVSTEVVEGGRRGSMNGEETRGVREGREVRRG